MGMNSIKIMVNNISDPREYYIDSYLFESSALIENICKKDDGILLQLNKTIFHPQGGGQPESRAADDPVRRDIQAVLRPQRRDDQRGPPRRRARDRRSRHRGPGGRSERDRRGGRRFEDDDRQSAHEGRTEAARVN